MGALSPKARQAKNKARLAAMSRWRPRRAQAKKLDFTEIQIPVGPRLGAKVLEAEHLHKEFDGRVLIDDLSFSCRATASWASSARTAWASPRCSR